MYQLNESENPNPASVENAQPQKQSGGPALKKAIQLMVLAIMLTGVFGGGYLMGKESVACIACKPETVDFSLFWDAYSKLKGHYIDKNSIADQKIIYGAIKGMTKSLGDPYTDFFDPAEAKEFRAQLAGSFEGIGAEVGIKKGQLTIIAPLKDSPAQKAGIKAGDLIVKINDKSTVDMSTEEAVHIIRGKGGTPVTLTIYREGLDKPKDIIIVRDTIVIPSMAWKMEQRDVAHISLYQFDQNLSADFDKAARQILSSPAKKIILDVRNNPGGYLQTAQDIAGWFLKSGQVVTLEDFGKGGDPQKKHVTDGNNALGKYPVVVLMNGGSASASEILAGALRDNRGIKLIGEKSFGKGSVQEMVDLQDGASFLKITIAKWLTPKGASISEVGLTPDVKAEPAEGSTDTKTDPQLDKALEILKGMN